VSTGKFGHDRRLYLLSHHNAPRGKILAVLLDHPDLSGAKTVVPEGEAPIREFLPTATRLYVVDLVGGPSRLRAVTLDGDSRASIEGDPISTVGGLVLLAGDRVLFSRESYLEPSIWYTYEPSTAPMVTALKNTASVQYSDCEVTRDFAISKDGTKVPINIIHRKGIMLDGSNPTILYGYGGFDVSMVPYFSVRWRVWLDQGGVCAIANLRGGSEFGEEWHNAGKLTRKQNVYDDFAACAQFLIDRKYTDPAKLAIEGGSNGGLLMGAALTQHPGLFRAVVSHVGIYDMLRVERFPNGEFNVTEFGSVTDPEQFKALYAYSPYHHVVDGTAYPAVLFLTGDNDGRVDPANSRKMTARLQAATSSNLPILLRTTATAGHGFGTSLSEEFAQDADIFAFLFDQLQVEYKPMQTQL
jgi:prolyl oligopeptidase